MCQQSTENIQTLLSTTDQLQHILNLATDARAGILNKEQVVVVQSELANRKKKLEAANSSIKELNTCETTPAVVAKHTRTEKRQVMVSCDRIILNIIMNNYNNHYYETSLSLNNWGMKGLSVHQYSSIQSI